jgi:hypothetical protein
MFEALRLNLEGIRIHLSAQKPLCTAQLNVLRINRRNFTQHLKKLFARVTVFNAQANVGDLVLHLFNCSAVGQGLQIMGVILTRVDKMSIAALYGETASQFIEVFDRPNERSIDISSLRAAMVLRF